MLPIDDRMTPINENILTNFEIHENCEIELEQLNQKVSLTYRDALIYVVNLLYKEPFLKYHSFQHKFKYPSIEGSPLIAAALNKISAKIYLILKNVGSTATFIEWDYCENKEIFSTELIGKINSFSTVFEGTFLDTHILFVKSTIRPIKTPRLVIKKVIYKIELTYPVIHINYEDYNKSHFSNEKEVDILLNKNLQPLLDDDENYLPPFINEIYLEDPMDSELPNSEEGKYHGKKYKLETMIRSPNHVLFKSEDFEEIRKNQVQRKNAYSQMKLEQQS